MIASFFSILISTSTQLFSVVGIIILVGFLLDFMQRKSIGYLYNTFGRKGYLLTAWIGTPIHELGHAIMCVIFRHRILEIQWFPVKTDASHLGFVSHSYNERSVYQRIGNFFIGIGPFFSGGFSIILLMYLLVPESYQQFTDYLDNQIQPMQLNKELITSIALPSWILVNSLFSLDHFIHPYFWIFIFLSMCISTHIALSKPDIKGAASGLITIFILLFIVNVIGKILNFESDILISSLAYYHAYILAFSVLAIFFSLMTLVICFIIFQIRIR